MFKMVFYSMVMSLVKDHTSTTPSPQTVTGTPPAYHQTVAEPPIPFAVAALATVAPILPLGVTALRERDDSTESDQSLTYSHSQPDAYRFM